MSPAVLVACAGLVGASGVAARKPWMAAFAATAMEWVTAGFTASVWRTKSFLVLFFKKERLTLFS
jgi:hypothetical protein